VDIAAGKPVHIICRMAGHRPWSHPSASRECMAQHAWAGCSANTAALAGARV